MRDNKELEARIEMIILADNKLPTEIRDKVRTILSKYEDVCSDVARQVARYSLENVNISNYIKRQSEEYERLIGKVLENAYEAKSMTVSSKLSLIKLDSEEEKVNEIINNRGHNETFINTVKQKWLDKMQVYKEKILSEIETMRTTSSNEIERQLIKERIKDNFETGVQDVIQKIETEFPEVGKDLDQQDRQTYERILSEIEQYKNSNFAQRREEFKHEVKKNVTVNTNTAVKAPQQENGTYNLLSGPVIE